jgi:hypothetical protein
VVSCLRLFGCEWCQIGANPVGRSPRVGWPSGAPPLGWCHRTPHGRSSLFRTLGPRKGGPALLTGNALALTGEGPGSGENPCSVSRGGSEPFICGEQIFDGGYT